MPVPKSGLTCDGQLGIFSCTPCNQPSRGAGHVPRLSVRVPYLSMVPLPILPELAGSYSPTMVALSVIVAVLASYVALVLASRVIAAVGRLRLIWLAAGAVAMGTGIWAMHFVGMLAFRLDDRPITYDAPHLVLSILVAMAASNIRKRSPDIQIL